MTIISDQVLHYLPFSAEPLLIWDENTDLLQFLCELNNQPGVIVLADGTRENINYSDTGVYAYQGAKKKSRSWAHQYLQSAMDSPPSPGAYKKEILVPDFYEDPLFGEMCKYAIAWEEVVGAALSSSAFFSIAHILESIDDLNCSLDLAARLYYKQASQVLRSFVEDLVLPVYFAQHPQSYSKWKADNYWTPSLRGRNGILKTLVSQEVMSQDLADQISTLYGDLNSFVHGSERRLLNKGQYTSTWLGHVFNSDDYQTWCSQLKESVSIGVNLLKINLDQWNDFRLRHTIMCPICHNTSEFSDERFVFGGEEFTRYHCHQCNHEMTHNYQGLQAYGQSSSGKIFSYQY